jgi:phosphonoacetate hydrolase
MDGSSKARMIEVNGRAYAPPVRPTVVICLDGWDPAYVTHGIAAGHLPTLARWQAGGVVAEALSVMPSFTNPNNLSIVTGVPPAIHGVSGNFYLDRATGETVMVTGDAELRVPTILAKMARAGVPTAVITAKDKLRAALSKGLAGQPLTVSASAERADRALGVEDLPGLVGAPVPDPYSAELSLFVLDAGLALLKSGRARMLYLSLSDYVMHRYAPDAQQAGDFLRAVDARIEALLAAGALVGATADHGMTDMAKPDGSANVVFLGDLLDDRFGASATRVICPITDPFVRHHGALGGFVRVHIAPGTAVTAAEIIAFLSGLPGVHLALSGDEACRRFELDPAMEGDVTVLGERGVALGARAADHDLSQLAGERLRSHGSLFEQRVPFLLSATLSPGWRAAHPTLRNFDIFDAVLNGVATS